MGDGDGGWGWVFLWFFRGFGGILGGDSFFGVFMLHIFWVSADCLDRKCGDDLRNPVLDYIIIQKTSQPNPLPPSFLRTHLHLILPSSHHHPIRRPAIPPSRRGAAAADRGRRADPGHRHGRPLRRAAGRRGTAAGRLGGAARHRAAALPRGAPSSPRGRGSHGGNHGGPWDLGISRRNSWGKHDEIMMKHDET